MKSCITATITVFAIGFYSCHSLSGNKNKKVTANDSVKTIRDVKQAPLPKLPDTSNHSIAGLFLMMPMDNDYLKSKGARDSLLRLGSDTLTHNSDDIEVLNLDSLSHNYMRFELGYTTGQEGIATYELKLFNKKEGGFLLVLSSYGGAHGMYSQGELTVFNVTGNTISINKDGLLPENINLREFAKEGVLDSVWKHISEIINYRYDLDSQSPDKIKIIVVFDEGTEDAIDLTSLKSLCTEFTWNGSTFSKKMLPLSENIEQR